MSEQRIFIDQSFWQNPLFADEPFGKVTAFAWLGCQSDDAGHLSITFRDLAKEWKWPETDVRSFLEAASSGQAPLIGLEIFGDTAAIAIGGWPQNSGASA